MTTQENNAVTAALQAATMQAVNRTYQERATPAGCTGRMHAVCGQEVPQLTALTLACYSLDAEAVAGTHPAAVDTSLCACGASGARAVFMALYDVQEAALSARYVAREKKKARAILALLRSAGAPTLRCRHTLAPGVD